jgi:Fic family protein
MTYIYERRGWPKLTWDRAKLADELALVRHHQGRNRPHGRIGLFVEKRSRLAVTIHPFEDGNGRMARAIADMALARSEDCAQRFYSMSAQIRQERNAYYGILEQTQKDGLDITAWLEWFLNCLDRAFHRAENTLANVQRKARFWECHMRDSLNERQRLIINRLFDGFDGKLNSSVVREVSLGH